MLSSCLFSSTCVTPWISRRTHPEGTLYYTMYKCVFLAHQHFFLFRPRVFSRALDSVARMEPGRTPRVSLGPDRGPWHVLWGFKVARPLGEGFRARRTVQAPANPRTWYLRYILTWVKKMSDGSCDTYDIECSQCRQTLLGDGNIFHRYLTCETCDHF